MNKCTYCGTEIKDTGYSQEVSMYCSIHCLPSGRFHHLRNDTEFTKHDTGKPMISLVEPSYIIGTAEVLTIGAAKYGKGNWKLCEDMDRYKDALLRHIMAYLVGELLDPETGLSHLHHASCNLMFLSHFEENKK